MILECVYNSKMRNVTTFVSKDLLAIYYIDIMNCREEKDPEMKCVLHFYNIIRLQNFLFVSVLLIHLLMMNG